MTKISTRLIPVLWLLAATPALTAQPSIGIVLVHGKWGAPGNLAHLAHACESQEYAVRTPEMPWSGRRLYDAPLSAALREIGDAVEELRKQGAQKVVVGGHSFGANAALAFGAVHPDIDGIMMLAPGHTPERANFRTASASSVERAKEMVAGGKGEEELYFDDLNQGRTRRLRTTASIYLSYFDPAGDAVMPRNAAAMTRPVPLLWVIGRMDPLYAAGQGYVFTRVPPHSKSRYVIVQADHPNTPFVATQEILAWLKVFDE